MVSTRALVVQLLVLIATIWVSPTTCFAADVDDFAEYNRNGVPGRLYIPEPELQSPEGHPLILFLHGAGERGTDNARQVGGNIDNLFENARERGAYLYAPQTSNNWNNTGSPPKLGTIMESIDLLDSALGNIDYNRLYVTGLSLGGGGTWNMLNDFSDRFAAGVPIAGIRPASGFEPDLLTDVPLWAFHAVDDTVVSYRRSEETVNSILSAAGQPAASIPASQTFVSDTLDLRYTQWPTGGHGIWNRVYDTPEMYDWMFSRSLSSSAIPEPGTLSLLALAFIGIGLRRAK